MSWKEKVKDFGGGDMAFLSEDGEVLDFIVVGEPVLLAGKFKGRPTEKIGCPAMTEDGFVLFVVGKRLFRKIAKHEEHFESDVLQAKRTGETGDINAVYSLKVLEDETLKVRLFNMKQTEFTSDMVDTAVAAALEVMNQ